MYDYTNATVTAHFPKSYYNVITFVTRMFLRKSRHLNTILDHPESSSECMLTMITWFTETRNPSS